MKTTLAAHFYSFEGSLYDNRTNKQTRAVYDRGFSRITNGAQLRSTLRSGQYTFPGCYPLYFVTSDGCALSFDSVRENLRAVLDSIRTKTDDGWRVVACEINYEDTQLYCEHSGELIESAYGDDEESETEEKEESTQDASLNPAGIVQSFCESDHAFDIDENDLATVQAHFEHGQWWIQVLATGQSFSVVDVEATNGTRSIAFEPLG